MKKNLPFLGNVDDIEETKDVLMNKVLHDYDFAENPFCIDQVLNMRQLLDSDLFACFAIFSRYHRAISALTNELDCLILDWQLEHNAFKVSASETWDIRLTGCATGYCLSGCLLLLGRLRPSWHLLLLLLEELCLVRLLTWINH